MMVCDSISNTDSNTEAIVSELQHDEIEIAQLLIQKAFEEDLSNGIDLTTHALVPEMATGSVAIVSRQAGVLSGIAIAKMVFESLDSEIEFEGLLEDGSPLEPGSVAARISGSMRSILIGERTALNFLTMLSGTASLTRKFVDAIGELPTKVLDTRKTIPGLRAMQKFAVRCGGGTNHRIGLYDAVLIKDNHLAWWKEAEHNLEDAVRHAREFAPNGTTIEIEVDSYEQLQQVLPASPDIVLLDNMENSVLVRSVKLRDVENPKVRLEASGGVTLERVRSIAETGVDRVSIGGLTHSAVALDLGFDWSTG